MLIGAYRFDVSGDSGERSSPEHLHGRRTTKERCPELRQNAHAPSLHVPTTNSRVKIVVITVRPTFDGFAWHLRQTYIFGGTKIHGPALIYVDYDNRIVPFGSKSLDMEKKSSRGTAFSFLFFSEEQPF